MPDDNDQITENLSKRYRNEINEIRILQDDGTSIVIGREITRVRQENGETIIQVNNEMTMDDLGNPIRSMEDFGGTCRCGNRAHKDFFFHCGRCGLPQCVRCVYWRDGVSYCSWCNMILGWRRLLGIFRRR